MGRVLGSRAKVKILGALATHPERWHTLYSIKKVTGLNNSSLKADLAELLRLGWVEASNTLAIKKFRYNSRNDAARAYLEFLNRVGYFDDDDTTS